ncbi:DUF943 family protein [Rouxiella sp. Mn2063]|uniref:DUF943 family protein n=1 Tax=Rouxiella sp. Mn2063 TaxID=3395262 RepID=UPI003BEABEAC
MKKIIAILIVTLLILLGGWLYLNNRTVNIIDAHYDKYSASIIVDHLPLTEQKKIAWWVSNQESIRQKYSIPAKSDEGTLKVYIWAFGDGYMPREKYDRLCFDDMKKTKNCIEKNQLMNIDISREGNVIYSFENDAYIRKENGELLKLAN